MKTVMKTVDERAREIRKIFGILDEPDNLEWICAVIRADREALLLLTLTKILEHLEIEKLRLCTATEVREICDVFAEVKKEVL